VWRIRWWGQKVEKIISIIRYGLSKLNRKMVYDFLGILLFLLVCPVKHVCGKKERRKKRKQLIDGPSQCSLPTLYRHCTDTVPRLYRQNSFFQEYIKKYMFLVKSECRFRISMKIHIYYVILYRNPYSCRVTI
jgi:hypothetical protein